MINGEPVNSRGYRWREDNGGYVMRETCPDRVNREKHTGLVEFIRSNGGVVRMSDACRFLKCTRKAFCSIMTGLSYYSPVIYHDDGEVGVLE